MKLQLNELMVGDWVHPMGHPDIKAQVKPEDYINLAEYEPIPLTPEILEKNGFTSDNNIATLLHRDDSKYELYKIKYVYYGSWLEMVDKVNDNKLRVHCYYTHELQHALRLLGIEKEIVL